jgi:hypothetical protein
MRVKALAEAEMRQVLGLSAAAATVILAVLFILSLKGKSSVQEAAMSSLSDRHQGLFC